MNAEIQSAITGAEKKGDAGTAEAVEISGLNIAQVRLHTVARERPSKNHQAHKHERDDLIKREVESWKRSELESWKAGLGKEATTAEAEAWKAELDKQEPRVREEITAKCTAPSYYAKLTQLYKCALCGEEVPFKMRAKITQTGKEEKEAKLYLTAIPKASDEDKPTGIKITGRFYEVLDYADVKQVFRIEPEHYTAKKDASREKANFNAVAGLCWASEEQTRLTAPLLCEYKGRPAVWKGASLFVLWYSDEQVSGLEWADYKKLTVMPPAIEGALALLKSQKPDELEVKLDADQAQALALATR